MEICVFVWRDRQGRHTKDEGEKEGGRERGREGGREAPRVWVCVERERGVTMKLHVVFADTRKPAFSSVDVIDTKEFASAAASGGNDADADASVDALRAAVAANASALRGGQRAAKLRDDRRIRLSCVPAEGEKRGAVLQAGKALKDFGLKDGDTVLVKVCKN